MLRSFLKILSPVSKTPEQIERPSIRPVSKLRTESSCHRQRLLGMKIEHTKMCGTKRCELLNSHGVFSCGDLMACDPEILSKTGAPTKTVQIIRRYRSAVRIAVCVPGISPRDALLLVSIHRRSIQGLASESATALYRDLELFSLSTKGRRLMRGRRIPSLRRVKRWIESCQLAIKPAPDTQMPPPTRGVLGNSMVPESA